jgi:hypothetical protein
MPMPMMMICDEITLHLKINRRRTTITDAEYAAWRELKDQEIISEATAMGRQYGIGLWSTSLVNKYLRPYSLGPGYPVSALGHVQGYGKAANLYRRSDVAKAWETVPANIQENRQSIVRGY